MAKEKKINANNSFDNLNLNNPMEGEPVEKPKLKGRGGPGRGGGRKLGQTALIAQELRAKMAVAFKSRFGPILEAQMDAALGIQTEAYDKKTGQLVYKDLGPNIQAFKTIAEQVMGRPTESVELSGKDGEPFIININK